MTPTMFGKCFWSDMHQRFNVTAKKLKWPIKNTDFENADDEINKDPKYLVWEVIFVVLESPSLKPTMPLENKGGGEGVKIRHWWSNQQQWHYLLHLQAAISNLSYKKTFQSF